MEAVLRGQQVRSLQVGALLVGGHPAGGGGGVGEHRVHPRLPASAWEMILLLLLLPVTALLLPDHRAGRGGAT